LVLLWSANRWSRDFADGMIEALRLHRRGIALADTSQGVIDSGTIVGRLQLSFGMAAAQEQSDRISADTRRGKAAQRAAGNFATRPPFGYRTTGPSPGRYLEPDPKQAPIVRQMFRWADQGVTAADIARRLQARGVTTARGSAWRACTVRTILVNPTYRGLVVHYGPCVIDGKRYLRFRVPQENWDIHEGRHEPLVPAALWERVSALWSIRVRFSRGLARRYPLSGLIVCGACGRTCTVVGSEKWKGYRCRPYGVDDCESTRTVAVSVLEEAVRKLIRELAGNRTARREAAKEIARKLADQAADEGTERARIEQELLSLTTKQRRLVAAIETGQAPRAVTDRLAEIEAAVDEARRRLDSVVAAAAPDLADVTAVLDAACQSDPDLWGLRDLDLQIVLPADDSQPVLRLLGETYPLPVKLARRLPQRRGR
jgi:hypothetical protein